MARTRRTYTPEFKVEAVKRGIDLVIRARAAATADERQKQREERDRERRGQPPPSVKEPEPMPSPSENGAAGNTAASGVDLGGHRSFTEVSAEAMDAVREARRALETGAAPHVVSQQLELTQSVIVELVSAADRMKDSAAMLRVLASLGIQMASFVHEIRGLLGAATVVQEAVGRLREDRIIQGNARVRLNEVYTSLEGQKRQIERQASYLFDLASTDARRRRSRHKLAEQFDSAGQLISLAAERRGVRISNEIPPELKSPPCSLRS